MKRFYNIIILSFVVASIYGANDTVQYTSEYFTQANQLYKEGEYAEAIKQYKEELKRGVSADLYYNLANAYYKQNEMGLAILNYERALKINPALQDAKYNLRLAEQRTIDKFDIQPDFFLKKMRNKITNLFTSNQWVIFAFLFFLSFLVLFLSFLFARTKQRRKLLFILSMVSLLFFFYGMVEAQTQKKRFLQHNKAIILQGAVTVKSSPNESGTDIFELHEGTKVTLKSELDGWVEVILSNGAVGWIKAKTVERI